MDYTQLVIQEMATSTQEERYLISYNDRYFETNISVIELLRYLQSDQDLDKAINSYIEYKKWAYTKEEISLLIKQRINPLFCNKVTDKKTFLYEKELLSQRFIDVFSSKFHFLFNKYLFSLIISLTVLNDLYFILFTRDVFQYKVNIDALIVVLLFVFTLFSSLVHEFGHASACKYFGIKHGGIGFGLYLTFPVLYTDVTSIWKLSRKQRCIVNLAGVYFQCYCLLGLFMLFYITHSDIIKYLILMVNLGFLMTLNPFFKFDGYWIASDLLGVPNLRKRSKDLLVYLYNRIKNNQSYEKPYLLKLKKIEKYGLLIYTIVVNIFMGYYFFYIIPYFMISFFNSFPNEIEKLIIYMSNNEAPPFSLFRNIVAQLFFIFFIVLFLVNVAKKIKAYVAG